MTAADRQREGRIRDLAERSRKLERELDRTLARAHAAGWSLRKLEHLTKIPRATLARRIAIASSSGPVALERSEAK